MSLSELANGAQKAYDFPLLFYKTIIPHRAALARPLFYTDTYHDRYHTHLARCHDRGLYSQLFTDLGQ